MAKFLAGKVTVVTWELEADSRDEAEGKIAAAESPLVEHPTDIKRTTYKLGWYEFDLPDPTPARNIILDKFLGVISKIPGLPEIMPPSVIIPVDEFRKKFKQ
jgi:hypothetical protein